MPGVHTLPAPWGALADAAGGVSGLSKILDVHQTTIWRWAHGQKLPSEFVQRAVNKLCSSYSIPRVFATNGDLNGNEEKNIVEVVIRQEEEFETNLDAEVTSKARKQDRQEADVAPKRSTVGVPKGRNAQGETGRKAGRKTKRKAQPKAKRQARGRKSAAG